MLNVLSITFPIFASIALGYVIVARGVFKPADMRVFGQYVLNIALPALLFNAVATRDVSKVFDPAYMTVFLIGGLVTIAVAYAWFTLRRVTATRRAVAVMGTTCPNSGFVGYPMLLLLYPDLAGQVLALNMLVENFVLIPISMVLIELGRSDVQIGLGTKLRGVLWDVVKRPMVLALAAGLLVSLSGLAIPAPVGRWMGMLAASASALSLFVIGGALVGVPLKGNRAVAGDIMLGKLVLHPAATAGVAMVLAAAGFGLAPELWVAVVLSTAMPIFGIYPLFAQSAGHEGMASLAQLGTTVGAFVTLNILLLVLL
ncbi:MAG: transporter [Rhodobacterales bacterium]|nr:MAG: transporter [Rhodobacterales bacterium]